ncbi:class I glutamine amidotransferase-like protein [Bombardia bombarda]|uniref:Class I glutamine amidotransferase-like protein n=1 Tax=Bombardia bombarda TaxID=252184 RepID=A0AA40CAK7_9PEZI|nr:class I glutamine amidotransferase-like protein [Bombardia bombarda]
MFEHVQLSDIVGIDIFGNLSREYMDQVKAGVPEVVGPFDKFAIDIEFLYLATTLEPTWTTPGMKILPTVTYDDCPRDLDMVIIGGPMPDHRPPQADRFMKEAWTKTPVWITTCIGSVWLASSGVLDGMTVTTNREFLGIAGAAHPAVKWLDQRWVVNQKPYDGKDVKGELWTSGGAGAGIDMIANYCLQHYDPKFVTYMALNGLQFNPEESNGQFYKL